MSVNPGRPPSKGGGSNHAPPGHAPSPTSRTPAWAGAASQENTIPMRSFSEIIQAESTRNIIQLKLKKISSLNPETNEIETHKSLNYEQLGEFIFDVLKVQYEDCIGLDFNTGRYDTREISLKPGIDVSSILTNSIPYKFANHEITVSQMKQGVTRVTFKFVPMNVPDEEIIHLCKAYGTPLDNKVHREFLRLGTSNSMRRTFNGSTRYVDLKLNPGQHMRNYYWLEGPLPGDDGRRITVLHSNQPAQCSHCLNYASTGCGGGGNGRLCEQAGVHRRKMSNYMDEVKRMDKYISLKSLYMEQQARSFPTLGSKKGAASLISTEGMDSYEQDEEEIIPKSPEEQKEDKITNLEDEMKSLKKQLEDKSKLEDDLAKALDQKVKEKTKSKELKRKLVKARQLQENKIADMIASESSSWEMEDKECNDQIESYATTLNNDDFEIDTFEDIIKPKNGDFLKNIEEKCNLKDEKTKASFEKMKKLFLYKMKSQLTGRFRSGSVNKRTHSNQDTDEDDQKNEPDASKQRTESPVKEISENN